MTEQVPFDPRCDRFAADMDDYDDTIKAELELRPDEEVTATQRENFVAANEGTYNPKNGHFLCDKCYIDVGMPSSPTGWKCP